MTMLKRVLKLLAALLVLKTTISVLLGYRDYFPANFASDFLHGRESYFFGVYRLAFYAHLAAGPTSLIVGMVLVSENFRGRFPKWHRRLGRFQIAMVLLVLVPSGAWMSKYAETGGVAGLGFFALAIATGTCAALGWHSAIQKQFADHRRWMWRCFLLLCSAVVIRGVGGLVTVTGIGVDWAYPLAAWASWLVPLATFETLDGVGRRSGSSAGIAHSASSKDASSFPAIEISARR